MGVVHVQSDDDVRLLDPVPMSWRDNTENSSEYTESSYEDPPDAENSSTLANPGSECPVV